MKKSTNKSTNRKKGDVSPMPNALIAVVVSLIFLVVIYSLVKMGIVKIEPIAIGASDCLQNTVECIKKMVG